MGPGLCDGGEGGGTAGYKPLKLLRPFEKSDEHENTPDVINYIPKRNEGLQEQICGAEIKYRCAVGQVLFQ